MTRKHEVCEYYRDFYGPFLQLRWHRDHFHLPLWERGKPLQIGSAPGERRLTALETLAWMIEFDRGVERMVDAVVRPAGLTPEHVVVDAGCGVGGAVRHLARRIGCRAFGVDASERQIAEAREKTDSSIEHLVQFKLADCSTHLPFPDNSVDAILNIESAGHYDSISGFLAECARILKPGGHFTSAELCSPESVPESLYDEIYSDLLAVWKYHRLQNQTDYKRLFAQAGLTFSEVEVYSESEVPVGRVFEEAASRFASEVTQGDTSYVATQAAKFFNVSLKVWAEGYIQYHRYHARKIGPAAC